jgi:hypothetical protein
MSSDSPITVAAQVCITRRLRRLTIRLHHDSGQVAAKKASSQPVVFVTPRFTEW